MTKSKWRYIKDKEIKHDVPIHIPEGLKWVAQGEVASIIWRTVQRATYTQFYTPVIEAYWRNHEDI